MKTINRWLARIPALLSSKLSIFIYLFLFCYLVVYALICLLVPMLNGRGPSDNAQLVLGNYTNVLSALGASIAAGAGVSAHSKIDALHKRHDDLEQSLQKLHEKLDQKE